MNKFMDAMKDATNFTHTENHAITHRTTKSALLDMFAMGAAMRNRPDSDVILMFRKAFAENPVYALKCLFYIRDVRGGQGERRFFRVVIKDMATYSKSTQEAIARNMKLIPEFGRWDDLYAFMDTPMQDKALNIIKHQLALDVQCKTPSLLAKWMPSENASSKKTIRLGNITRSYLNMTHKEYRRTLAILRSRINIVEKLMSENRWDEIEFDKIPSRAGLIYKNAFARHDIIKEKFAKFAQDENTKVNATTLYPYEVVEKALRINPYHFDYTDRAMVNKYWENLTDYFNGANLNALAVVDTSGSMHGTPINVAISLGMYCAERAGGPFANHYISFASRPQLIECEGVDFFDKVHRIYRTNLVDNTNIEAVFDLLLDTAKENKCSQEDLPQNILIISDMEFDEATSGGHYDWSTGRYIHQYGFSKENADTVMEGIAKKWAAAGYIIPRLIFWNVDARQANIAMKVENGISFVSGFSPSIFQQIMSGKTAFELMYEVLDQSRYSCIK